MKIRFALVAILSIFAVVGVSAGSSIVFTGEKDKNSDIYLVDCKSMEISRLTREKSNEEHPTISPDGKKIAFISDKDGAKSIYIIDLIASESKWVNVSAGSGTYSYPEFSPDGTKIAVSYAPDPKNIWNDTGIVLLDPQTRKQSVIFENAEFKTPDSDGPIAIVDRPHWIDEKTLIFVRIEYSDLTAPRMTASTLYRLEISDDVSIMKGKTVRLTGGESYFDENGRPRGFMASIPFVNTKDQLKGLISFSAIQGRLDRIPMSMSREGKDKKIIPVNDPDFFGPLFIVDGQYCYVYRDGDEKMGLVLNTGGKKSRRQEIPFDGNVRDPVPVP